MLACSGLYLPSRHLRQIRKGQGMKPIPIDLPGHRMAPVHCQAGCRPAPEITRFPGGERTVLRLTKRGRWWVYREEEK